MTAAPPETPLLVTARHAAAMLAMSERTLWGLDIPRIKIGARGIRYAVADLEAWIKGRRVDGATV